MNDSDSKSTGDTVDDKPDIEAPPALAGQIKVNLGDLVKGEPGMLRLSEIVLTGKVSYRISKALKKGLDEVNDYKDKLTRLIRELGGKPNNLGGLSLDKEADSYDDSWKQLQDHQLSALEEEVIFTGLKTTSVTELIEAMPFPTDENGKKTGEAKGIKPFILSDLFWLITEE